MVESHTTSIKNLNAGFGKKVVLKDININLPANKITAIIGPSGCGKSTFLNCLGGLIHLLPQGWMNGDLTIRREDVGFVFQKPTVFPISIEQNLHIVLKEHGIRSKSEVRDKTEFFLKKVGLWEEVHNRLGSNALALSGGQQQRLCIARALIREPKILLFDEPCSQLDPISSGKVEDLLVDLKKEKTIVLVTHNLFQARRVADFCAMFWNKKGFGQVESHDTTENLWGAHKESLTFRYLNGSIG